MSAEASLAAAGVTGGGARALLALMAAGGAAGEALARLIEDADAARALALSSGAEAAAARAEADESGTLLRGAERELERARGEIESLVSNGVALAGEYRGEAERARSSANALYCPRSESSEGARNRPGGTGEGLRLCEYFEAMAAPGDDAATGDAAFAEMGEAELALLPDDARAEVERARAAELEALEGRREADALLASVIGRDRAVDGGGGGKGAARRRRAASPPLAERFAGLEQRWVLALPEGGTAEFATRGEAEAAAAEAASALGDVGLRPMSIEERTELVLVPARVVAEHTLRPKYRARVRASSDLEAKELVSARVVRAQLAALRVSGLARARILAAGAPAAPDGRAAARRDVFLSTEARPALVRGSYVSPSLGAALCAALVCGSLPVWRQLSMPWPFCGADVPPSVAARWVNELYEKKLRHLMEPLGGRLLAGDVVHADETPIRVLRVGKGKSKSYMWLFSTPAGERFAVRLFCHAPDRRGSNAVEVLGDFAGWLVTDAYPGYNLLEAAMHAFCLIHARRKFWDALCVSTLVRPSDWALACVTVLDDVFAAEREIDRDLPPEERLALRRESMCGLVAKLDELCAAIAADPCVPKRGKLATAVAYWQNNREELTAFLRDGRLCLHNMVAEQMARRVSLYRKNSMFCGSEVGADARACLLSLVETARANGLDPYSYLEFVLERMRGDGFAGDEALLESLMPWSKEAKAACARAADVPEPPHDPVGAAA